MQEEILSLSTTNRGGGAEKIATTIHEGLLARDWKSRLLVGRKTGEDPSTIAIHASPYFDYRTVASSVPVKFQHAILARDRFLGREAFHYPFTHSLTSIAGLARPNAILAHNLHGGYFDLRALPEISASHPFYWYLHDFWSFTGHCAFPLDCERWVTGCGSCPYLEIPPAIRRDNTRKNWRVKEGIYQNSKIHLIVPCEWLAGQVRESVLGHHGYPITVIPYGIDLELFRPPASPRSMEYKDDPEQELTGIFVANGPRSNPYKHFALLEKAMPELDARLAKRAGRSGRIRILAVGEPEESCLYEGKSVTLKVIPFVNETQVAKLLQSSDFYLHPSHNEITPLAIYEAMACGLPVIASNVGGIAEMFADHSEGLLVHDPTPDAWVDAILQLTGNLQGLREMGSAARARMESLGGSSRMLDQIESLLSDRARR